jgi:bacillithiol synthase
MSGTSHLGHSCYSIRTLTENELFRPILFGEPPVKSECLPFGQIPHTTRLFNDFLYSHPKVQQFYPRSAYFKQWFKDEASAVQYDPERRRRVCDVLERQNRSFGASAKALENIARLRAGASAMVSGQQVGLFGGPAFSIFKALTAVRLADEATRAGVDCVPVFWLATTDHDLDEIRGVAIPGPDGSLQKLVATTQGVLNAPVGTIAFGEEINPVVEAAIGLLGSPESAELLRGAYRPSETFGSAFGKLFARLLADWGVILMDGADPEFQQIASPIYRAAVERADELDDALLSRGKALEAAGYHQQVKVTASSTLLFALQKGARIPMQRHVGGNGSPEFLIRDERISQAELVRRIESSPQDFSANVLLRPVIQDYLLPTVAYAGGSSEVAYFAQVGVVYEALLGRITPIVPRFSATVLESKPQSLLARYGLRLADVFLGVEALRERLAAGALPKDIQLAFDHAEASLEKSMAEIREGLRRLDSTLVDAASNAANKMEYQLSQLRAKAARAELRQSEILGRHAELLSNALYPNKGLQEREVSGMYFVARHGVEWLREVYDAIQPDCVDHQIVSL